MQYETGEGVSYIESGSYVPEAPTLEGGSADVGTPWPCEFSHTVDGRSGRAAHGAANTITYFLRTVGIAALGVGRPRGSS